MKTGNFTFGWVRNRARRRPGASQVVTSIQHKDVGRYLSNQRIETEWKQNIPVIRHSRVIELWKFAKNTYVNLLCFDVIASLVSSSNSHGFWPNRNWNFTSGGIISCGLYELEIKKMGPLLTWLLYFLTSFAGLYDNRLCTCVCNEGWQQFPAVFQQQHFYELILPLFFN